MRQLVRRAASAVPYWVPQVSQTRRSSREYRISSSAGVVIVLVGGGLWVCEEMGRMESMWVYGIYVEIDVC